MAPYIDDPYFDEYGYRRGRDYRNGDPYLDSYGNPHVCPSALKKINAVRKPTPPPPPPPAIELRKVRMLSEADFETLKKVKPEIAFQMLLNRVEVENGHPAVVGWCDENIDDFYYCKDGVFYFTSDGTKSRFILALNGKTF